MRWLLPDLWMRICLRGESARSLAFRWTCGLIAYYRRILNIFCRYLTPEERAPDWGYEYVLNNCTVRIRLVNLGDCVRVRVLPSHHNAHSCAHHGHPMGLQVEQDAVLDNTRVNSVQMEERWDVLMNGLKSHGTPKKRDIAKPRLKFDTVLWRKKEFDSGDTVATVQSTKEILQSVVQVPRPPPPKIIPTPAKRRSGSKRQQASRSLDTTQSLYDFSDIEARC
jgi:hypothetical protein